MGTVIKCDLNKHEEISNLQPFWRQSHLHKLMWVTRLGIVWTWCKVGRVMEKEKMSTLGFSHPATQPSTRSWGRRPEQSLQTWPADYSTDIGKSADSSAKLTRSQDRHQCRNPRPNCNSCNCNYRDCRNYCSRCNFNNGGSGPWSSSSSGNRPSRPSRPSYRHTNTGWRNGGSGGDSVSSGGDGGVSFTPQ